MVHVSMHHTLLLAFVYVVLNSMPKPSKAYTCLECRMCVLLLQRVCFETDHDVAVVDHVVVPIAELMLEVLQDPTSKFPYLVASASAYAA